MNLIIISPIRILRIGICYIMLALSMSYSCSVLIHRKWTIQFFLRLLVYQIPMLICNMFSQQNTTWMPILSYAMHFLFLYITCKLRGMQLYRVFFLITAFSVGADILAGIIFSHATVFSEADMALARNAFSPLVYLVNALVFSLTVFFAFCYSVFSRTAKERITGEQFFRFIRPFSLILCIIALFYRTMQRTAAFSYVERFRIALPEFIVILLLLILGGSYMVQDIKFLRQSRLNSALLYQKEAQDILLSETRTFRHNIANLLYGFQGTLLSHDQKAVEDYYNNLVSTCAIVNNENVVSLQRIPSMAVSTLLLSKIKQVNEEKIPFYLFTDETLIYRGLSDKEMCEVLGALLDNAIESTRESIAPLISVEFHNAGNDMEVVVRNTFDEKTVDTSRADILFPTVSIKKGHEGIGLSTVNRIVSKNSHLLFNLYVRGRYIEASLLLPN